MPQNKDLARNIRWAVGDINELLELLEGYEDMLDMDIEAPEFYADRSCYDAILFIKDGLSVDSTRKEIKRYTHVADAVDEALLDVIDHNEDYQLGVSERYCWRLRKVYYAIGRIKGCLVNMQIMYMEERA